MVGGLVFLSGRSKTVMKTRDYVHEYRGNGPAITGLCGVRLYEGAAGERPVLVLTEPPEDTGYAGP